MSFDTSCNLATWRNAAGATVTLTYAGSPAKLVSVTNDFRRQLTFAYDSDLLTRVQDDSGRSVSYIYDPSGNLIGFSDTLGNLTRYAYAAPGQLTTVVNPSFPSTPFVTNTYDSLGRVMTQTDANGGTTTISITDADNREVLEYDGSTGAILRWYAYALGPNDVLNQMNVPGGTRSVFLPDIQRSVIATVSWVDSGK